MLCFHFSLYIFIKATTLKYLFIYLPVYLFIYWDRDAACCPAWPWSQNQLWRAGVITCAIIPLFCCIIILHFSVCVCVHTHHWTCKIWRVDLGAITTSFSDFLSRFVSLLLHENILTKNNVGKKGLFGFPSSLHQGNLGQELKVRYKPGVRN